MRYYVLHLQQYSHRLNLLYFFLFGEQKNPFHLSGFEPQDYARILISDDKLVFLTGPNNAKL